MPIKTEFLELNKIQENEYYNTNIENDNLDKIDAIIKNHDSRTSFIENKFNKKDQLKIEFSAENKVQSVRNSFGGTCNFEIDGKLIKNILDKSIEKDVTPHKYNYVVVEANKPYILKNTTSMSIHLYYGNQDVLSEPIGYVLPHKTLKFTPSKSNISLYLIDGTGKTFGETMMVEGNEIPNSYFKDIQPLRGVSLESTGKNLFDKNNAYDNSMVSLNGKITYIANDKQWVATNPIDVREGMKLTLPSGMYFFTDVNWKHKVVNTGQLFNLPISQTITIPEGINGPVIFNINKGGLNVGDMKSLKIQIEEAEIPTDFEAYVSSKLVFEDALASLPNGVADKIVRKSSKTIKYIHTNLGRDSEFHIVKKSDVEIYTKGANVNLVRVKRSSLKDIARGMVSGIVINNKSNIERNPSNPWDDTQRIGEYSTNISKTFVDFIVDKNIDTLDKAQLYIVGTKLAYQLISPIKSELTDELEALMSYDVYTQFGIKEGFVERERIKLYDSGSYHYFNYKTEENTHSKLSVQFFERILHKQNSQERDITKYCLVEKLDIYKDDLGFAILNEDIKKYNIDVNHIYVIYKTSESNNQAKVKLTYNSNLSDTISSNSTSINRLGEQIDYLTNKIDSVIEFSPLLQNKAKEMPSYKHKVSIEKNRLYMEGKVATDKVTSGATIMTIGKTYAPKTDVSFIVSTNALEITASIQITSSGDVKLFYKGGSPKEITLNQIAYGIGDSHG